MRIVADTNVLASAALHPDRMLARILDLAAEGRLRLFVSSFILAELKKVLISKMRFDPRRTGETIAAIKEIVEVIEPRTRVDIIKTKEADNRILECALEAGADVLVTGNMADIRPLANFQGIEILTPREFLDKYFPAI